MRFYEFNQIVSETKVPSLKLRWDNNTNTFSSWLMSEVTNSLARELKSWQEENPDELPFHGIFPSQGEETTTRIVIPFVANPEALNILNKIEKSGLTLDFKNGTVSDGKRATRLGKLVLNKNSSFSESEKKWWNHSPDPITELKKSQTAHEYSIVVSRNPIDIARMSDHDGWTSCHAPNREYFSCAIADAKGGGAIAYVVKDLDLQLPEIFKDNSRGRSGVTPVSRVRLRKFVHNREGYDLAVPEDRTYGQSFPGLTDAVRDWALKSQQNVLKGKRVSMDEFKLMGGSYQDTRGSHLFNHFFGDDEDSGDAEYGGTEGGQGLFDQYEEEVAGIEEEFKDSFTICHFHSQVDESDNEPYVYFGGSFIIEIPENLSLITKENHDSLRTILKNWARQNTNASISDIEIDDNNIRFDLDANEPATPDGFRSFLENDLTDIEKNKDELKSSLYQELVSIGGATANKITQIRNDINDSESEDHQHSFQNFEWDVDDDHEVSISLKNPISLPGTSFDYQTFENLLKQQIQAWSDNVLKAKQRQMHLFQGIENKAPFKMLVTPEIYIRQNQLRMKLLFKTFTEDEHVEDSIALTNFLDKNFNQFIGMIHQLVHKLEAPPETPPAQPWRAYKPSVGQSAMQQKSALQSTPG